MIPMARLSEIRAAAERAIEPIVAAPPVEEVVIEEEEGYAFDEEDFYEAIDLLETSLTVLRKILRRQPDRLLANHCDDLAQFIGEFVEVPLWSEVCKDP
jgi:hypothetical protein